MVALLSVCCVAQSPSPNDGSVQDSVYTNFFFRLRYQFTASWVPQPASVAEELQKAAEPKSNSTRTDPEKSYHLLTLFRTLPGQGPAGRERAVISLIASDNSAHPEIASGREVVVALAEKMKARHYGAIGEPKEVTISGQSFFRQDMKSAGPSGVPVYESLVFTVIKGYSFGFRFVSPSKSLLTSMVASLDKASFY